MRRSGRWNSIKGMRKTSSYKLAQRVGMMNKLGSVKVVLSKRRNDSTVIALVTNDISLSMKKVVRRYLKRWSIEGMINQQKQNLGMGDYDCLYQLINVDYNDGNSTAYIYDALGNRTDVNDGSSTAYVSNNLNQYTSVGGTSYSYGVNGNLSDDNLYLYYYDCENRLIDVNDQNDAVVASYSYDYLGRRVKKVVYGSPDVTTGATNNVSTSDTLSHFLTAFDANSGPLSLRIYAGQPLTANKYLSTSVTSGPLIFRLTSIARHSRVNSSITTNNFISRPFSSRSVRKS